MARGGRGFQGTVLKALRAPEHKLTITAVRELAPYTELTVHCPSLLVMGGTSYRLPSPGDKMLLVGDQASAPALADAVAAAPPSSLATVVMMAPEAGFLPLAARDHRLIRVNPEVSEEKLLAAVDRTLWADTGDLALDWVFIALETSATKAVRRPLIASGLSRRSIQHQGYWTRGRAMGD